MIKAPCMISRTTHVTVVDTLISFTHARNVSGKLNCYEFGFSLTK